MLNKESHKGKTFFGVAMAIILFGTFVFALGVVEWLFTVCKIFSFIYPAAKVFAGVVMLALGYIVLELELTRVQK